MNKQTAQYLLKHSRYLEKEAVNFSAILKSLKGLAGLGDEAADVANNFKKLTNSNKSISRRDLLARTRDNVTNNVLDKIPTPMAPTENSFTGNIAMSRREYFPAQARAAAPYLLKPIVQ